MEIIRKAGGSWWGWSVTCPSLSPLKPGQLLGKERTWVCFPLVLHFYFESSRKLEDYKHIINTWWLCIHLFSPNLSAWCVDFHYLTAGLNLWKSISLHQTYWKNSTKVISSAWVKGQLWKSIPASDWATRLWGKVPIPGAGCLHPVQSWKAAPWCRCSSPRGCLEQHSAFFAQSNPTKHYTPHGSCVWQQPCPLFAGFLTHTVCLPISPFPSLMCFATVHVCCSVSSVPLYFFGTHGSFYSWCLHFKNARKGSSILEQKCPGHSLSPTSSFSFKGIVWINERLFIAGTKCSDMPEMSKCYYAPLKGPLFRDRNGNFMPLQWNHKYHFKPCP